MFTFLRDNWLELGTAIVGLLSAAAGVFAFYANKKRSGVEISLSIAEAHKEIWGKFLENPSLHRVTDDEADLEKNPVTADEEAFVFLILSHLGSALNAIEQNQFKSPEGLTEDLQNFFSKPIPKSVAIKHFESQPRIVKEILGEALDKDDQATV